MLPAPEGRPRYAGRPAIGVGELRDVARDIEIVENARHSCAGPLKEARMTTKNSEYRMTEQGGFRVFSVTPGRVPKLWGAIGLGVVSLIFAFTAGSTTSLFFMLFGLALSGLLFWAGLFRDLRPTAHREPRTFKVSPDTIESNGRIFKKSELHNLIVKNGMATDRILQSWARVPALVESGSSAAHLDYRLKVADQCYGLNVETGGKSYMLAGGMDETTASGLWHDVRRTLELKENN
jgi:hypothetical protein